MSAIAFVPPRVAFTDPETGLLTRAGVLFLQGIFNRIGGATGQSAVELVSEISDYTTSTAETDATLFDLSDLFAQEPIFDLIGTVAEMEAKLEIQFAELSALRDQVAEVVKEIVSLQQGTVV